MRNKKVKTFLQADSRWGRLPYPVKPYIMSGSGCGPTACADLIVTNPKYKNVTPKDTRKYFVSHGYAVPGWGSDWDGIKACLTHYGFKVTNHATMDSFFSAMKKGRLAIILFRKGTRGGVTWTTVGHFVACSGMKIKNGKHYLYIHDPGFRQHNGWYCYETQMMGLIPQIWSCYLPEKKTKKTKKKTAKKTKKVLSGFDISAWQGVNSASAFKKAKKSGRDFVIIRLGYNRELNKDSKFESNYKNAINSGLKVGVYYYSTARSTEDAKREANYVLKVLNKRKLTYPVFIDFEDPTQANLGKTLSKNIVHKFCSIIEKAGYPAGVYASYNFLTNKIGTISKKYYVWLAQYPKSTYKSRYELHQFSSSGKVKGFSGHIDVNVSTLAGGKYPTNCLTSTNPKVQKSKSKKKKKKGNKTIAREVIAGKWGNGDTRKRKLKAAGYNFSEIQKIVNKLL